MPTKEKGASVPTKGKSRSFSKNKFACHASLASKEHEKQLTIKAASDVIFLETEEKEPEPPEKWGGAETIVSRTLGAGPALVPTYK